MTEWLGYLEHKTPYWLQDKSKNIGKGGYTIFAEKLGQFQGLPWCVTFIFSEHPKATYLGRPCSGVLTLILKAILRFRWRSVRYRPKKGDLIICRNILSKSPDHVGTVLYTAADTIASIDANTVDEAGRFMPYEGGCVSMRYRDCKDPRIVGYIKMGCSKYENL